MPPEQVSWLSLILLAAPSHPSGQWRSCGVRHDYSRGAAEAFNLLPLIRGNLYAHVSSFICLLATHHPLCCRIKNPRTFIRFGDAVFHPYAAPNPRGAILFYLSRSSGFRIILSAAPSHPSGQWHSCGDRPRLRRRDRDGFSPSSLLWPTGRWI